MANYLELVPGSKGDIREFHIAAQQSDADQHDSRPLIEGLTPVLPQAVSFACTDFFEDQSLVEVVALCWLVESFSRFAMLRSSCCSIAIGQPDAWSTPLVPKDDARSTSADTET